MLPSSALFMVASFPLLVILMSLSYKSFWSYVIKSTLYFVNLYKIIISRKIRNHVDQIIWANLTSWRGRAYVKCPLKLGQVN